MEEVYDKDGFDITETTEWVSDIVKEDGVIREELVDADVVIDDAHCDTIAVELFMLVMDRVPEGATKAFRKLMRLEEKYGDTASAVTMFLMSRR